VIGKYHHFPQETLRERLYRRGGRQQVLERDPFQTVESRRFVGELAGRQTGMLPKLAMKRAFRMVAALGEFAVAGRLRQMIVLTKMLHELPRLFAGHSSSSLAASTE
jgi:hypothetical protein